MFFPVHGGFKEPGNPILNRPAQGRADTTDDIRLACLLVPTPGKWLSLFRPFFGAMRKVLPFSKALVS